MTTLRSILKTYLVRLRAFQPNARLYLVYVIIMGATMGVFRLIFNFYVLSLGFDEAMLGKLISTTQFTGMLLAIPIGFLVDKIGRKPLLISKSIFLTIAIGAMALWRTVTVFYTMNALLGVVQSISAVVMAPFLMDNSEEKERTYLFSFSSGLRMGSVFIGNWLGGYLPGWIANLQGIGATSSASYGGALLSITAVSILGFIPLSFIRTAKTSKASSPGFAPFQFAMEEPKLIVKLLFPSLLISIGAGMFMPFMNIFFRIVHHQSDQVIGTIFAWGSLAMGIGLMIAPPLADRLGKIQLVALTQGLSIPFMIMLGFSPLFSLSTLSYYMRMVLMNMSGPIYQTFVMEQVDKGAMATIASLASMVSRFGRAFSPTISGALQVTYGFGPPFATAIFLYAVAVFLYWVFFLRGKTKRQVILNSGG